MGAILGFLPVIKVLFGIILGSLFINDSQAAIMDRIYE